MPYSTRPKKPQGFEDYKKHGFTSVLTFEDLRDRWRKLSPDLLRPYLESRRLWPLTSRERLVLRAFEGFPYRFGRTQPAFCNALIACLSTDRGVSYFQALLLGPDWRSPIARETDETSKPVKARISVGPWLEDQQKFLPIPRSAAVRLAEPKNGILAVAEGVETAMSFTRITGYPCWARTGVHLMKSFDPPEGLRNLVVARDADKPGTSAYELLVQRLRRIASSALPDPGFNDFNDEWMASNGQG